MSITELAGGNIDIEVEGAPLNPLVSGLLAYAEVDTAMFVPSQFKLVFRGTREEVLDAGGLQLAVMVMIQINASGVPTPIMSGEITAVEVDYGPEGNMTVVRGMDRSHRLMRGTNTMAYPEMTASDVVTTLVAEAGVLPGEILPTTNIYPWLSQANVSAWTFIQQLCALENCVAWTDALGLFNFGPMTQPETAGPPPMIPGAPLMGGQLAMGVNLLRLRAVVNAGEQVPAVTAMGWNSDMSMPTVGVGPGIPSTAMPLDPAALPAAVAEEFEAKPFFETSRPYDTEGAAQTRAEAVAADIAGAMAELEGECLGNPNVLAGKAVALGQVGAPFDGMYVVTEARHVFDSSGGGYTTWFTVGGRRDRSLLALASGATQLNKDRPTIPGLVIGTVMDNADEESQGRVKVMFPWLAPAYVSAWAPTVQLSASPEFGSLWIPEIGDQVLVGFDRGDIDHPFVLGNLYNGLIKPIPAPETEGVVGSRRIMSRMRHMIEFNDGPEQIGITIQTGDEANSIKIDTEEQTITITTPGQVKVEAAGGISFETAADISMQAGGSLSVTAGAGFSVDSGGSIGLTGTDASITAPSVSVEAAEIALGA